MIRTIVLFLFPLFVQSADLGRIRKECHAAVSDSKAAEKFYTYMKAQNTADPLLMAYLGWAEAIMARHAINPYKKISYLKTGMRRVDASVAKRPDELELRYIRFSLEHHIPSFLGYNKHLELDRKKIVDLSRQQKFGDMDKALLLNLLKFMKETRRCSPQEIAILDHAISNG